MKQTGTPARYPVASTPTVLQMEAVECGAASLAMILAFHGRWVPLSELRYECGVSRDGSKASNIVKAARRFGLDAKGFKKEVENLKELEPPFIVFWNFNHFLVVEGFKDGKVHLNDPAAGPRQVTEAEFDEAFTGVTLVMKPGPEFKKGGEAPNPLKSLRERLRGDEGTLLYCIVAGLVLVVPGIITPLFVRVYVDRILVHGAQSWLEPLLIGMSLTALSRGFLKYLQLRALRRLNLKLSTAMTGKFLWHVLRLPASYFSQRFAGEIAGRANIATAMATTLSRKVALLIIDALTVLLYAIVLWTLDPVLTSIGVVAGALQVAAVRLAMPRANVNLKHAMELGKAQGVAIAGLQSIETIKASGLEADFFSRWCGYYTKAMNSHEEVALQGALTGTIPPFLSMLVSASVLIIGGERVMQGHLTIGTLIAFQALMAAFMAPLGRLVSLGSLLREVTSSVTRLDDLMQNELDTETTRVVETKTDSLSYRLKGYVELRNVTFGYSPLEPPLIENFSLILKPGQRVALIGGSGSGKSTVAKLVSGLYQPWSGEIYFDGKPRSAIERSILTQSVATVDQDIFLFAGTVRENLALWDPTVTEEHIMRACRDADVHPIIARLPGAYSSKLAEGGANLSGGQRQRLEIARALFNDPAILVLDEATSALDAESERLIDYNIRKRGCTCIVIAHRLSTIRDADEIIVLDRGKVVQRGTHDQLRVQQGHYLELLKAEGAMAGQTASRQVAAATQEVKA